jgi:hypothetical protein
MPETITIDNLHSIDIPTFASAVDMLCQWSHAFPSTTFLVGANTKTLTFFICSEPAAMAGAVPLPDPEKDVIFYGDFNHLRALAISFAVAALGITHEG